MFKPNYIYCLPLLMHIFSVNSQKIQTYNGKYEKGNATYQYYEDSNYERILNGSFSYTEYPFYSQQFKVERKISGNYLNNKKNGKWSCQISYVANNVNSKLKSANGNSVILGNYKNGLKDGIWISRSKSIVNSKNIEEVSTIKLRDGILIGEIKKDNINGAFNDKGEFIGNWTIKNKDIEYIAEFNNNIFSKLIVRNITNGNVLLKYIDTKTSMYNITNETKIDGNVYELTVANKINRGYSINYDYKKLGLDTESMSEIEMVDNARLKMEYFTNFIEFIEKYIKPFDSVFENIQTGSSSIIINYPMIATLKFEDDIDKQ